jgi:hypothetical protein
MAMEDTARDVVSDIMAEILDGGFIGRKCTNIAEISKFVKLMYGDSAEVLSFDPNTQTITIQHDIDGFSGTFTLEMPHDPFVEIDF